MNEKITSNSISNSEYEQLVKNTINSSYSNEKSIVEGKVVSIDKNNVLIDVGSKSEGRIPLSEFTRPGQEAEVKIGDRYKVFIDTLDSRNGETMLSREKAIKQESWDNLKNSYEKGEKVVGIPYNRVKGGLSVDLNGVVAFLPGSQIDSKYNIKDTKELLNKPMDCVILKMDKIRGNIVVSRKAIVEKQLKDKREKLLSKINEGSIVKGRVKNITDYGAFVDLGGIDGLVHKGDLSWKSFNHPSEILNNGEEIEVKIIKYDEENTRLSLGIKQLTDDPWEKIKDNFTVGEKYNGKIININDSNVSVSLKNEFEGYVQQQDITWLKKPPHPSKIVQMEEEIEVKLLEIDNEKRRLVCGIKQLKENPWDNIESIHKIGEIIETEIVNKVDFGIFVKIHEEIDGMVHISDLSWEENKNAEILKSLKKGEKVKLKILEIDKQKERISLSMKHLENDPISDYISKNPINSFISGTILATEEKGVVVELEKNVTGFIKKINLAKEKSEQKIERFAIGEKIDSMIISFDEKTRKINLSVKDKEVKEEQEALSQFGSSESGASLGDILGEALDKKKST
ncbi:MAG: 30S ribosomal protein S1 [Alphaproteobacteria bacterium MarineAlpha5_Bin9]|nr:MAG: 30S ribosomal protein S1 [Alphaproteobacteria bacterium MarineAlpha5_Bin9]|tara:strand:- start:325 stop:2034 length:1710 start_codon:yes stop_codon:yes gene_type:complete